jgi:hypothetical protein
MSSSAFELLYDCWHVVLAFLEVRDVCSFSRVCARARERARAATFVAVPAETRLSAGGLQCITARFPRLRALAVGDCSALDEEGLCGAVRRMHALSGMSLSRVRITAPLLLDAVAASAAHMRGGILRLEGAIMLPRSALAALGALSDLAELHLCGASELTDRLAAALIARSARTLRRLSLDDCAALTSVAVSCELLSELSCARCAQLGVLAIDAPRLQALRLPHCRALAAASVHDALRTCRRLCFLDVSNCAMVTGEVAWGVESDVPRRPDVDAPACGGLVACGAPHLERLVVHRADIVLLNVGGATRLRELVLQLGSSPLHELDLSCLESLERARVSGLLLRLLDASWCTRLRALQARDGCPRLRTVRIRGTPLEAADAEGLEVPDCCRGRDAAGHR